MEKTKRDPGQMIIRIMSTGLDINSYFEAMNRTEINLITFQKNEDPEDFWDVCIEMAERQVAFAEKELAAGHTEAAGEAYYDASQLLRWGDYGILVLDDKKRACYQKCADYFRKGLSMKMPHTHIPVEIPFEGNGMPGILTLPVNADTSLPTIIMIPGATGFKEECFGMLRRIHNLGYPTIVFDGPGQGEALFNRGMLYEIDNYERAVSEVIDFAKADPRLGDKVVLYGHSYGGYLSARAACFNDDKIDGVIARGGTTRTSELVRGNYIKKFKMKLNETDDDKARVVAEQMNIEPFIPMITKPFLVVQGSSDNVYGTIQGSLYMHEHASSEDNDILIVQGAMHGGGLTIQTEGYINNWLNDRFRA